MNLLRRLRYLFQRSRRNASFYDEMQFHVDFRVEDLMAEGRSREEAEAMAHREFGNRAHVAEEARGVWIASILTDFAQDLRYAVRNLARQPGFAAAAVLSAGLGIAVCTTIFSIANTALFRPPAIQDPERAMSISLSHSGQAGGTMSHPHFDRLRKDAKSFESIAAYFPMVPASIAAANGEAKRHFGWLVSANYFQTVGLVPFAGRVFDPAGDDAKGAPPRVVLSHRLWRSRFNADPSVVGGSISLNGATVEVAGIAPAGFHGHETALVADFWVPMSMLHSLSLFKNDLDSRLSKNDSHWLFAVARLRPSATPAMARAELGVIDRSPELASLGDGERKFYMERAGQISPVVRGLLSMFFALLLGISILVLSIACVNVANLLLARASAREAEIATRLAIGAGRGRIVRQLLTESALLALVGGAAGMLLAYWAASAIGRFRLPFPLPLDFSVHIDTHVLGFCVLLSVLTGIAFGLMPALRATRQDLSATMKRKPGSQMRLKNTLAAAQVAISTVLLVVALLFLRSLSAAGSLDLGLDPNNILLAGIDPELNGYDRDKAALFFDRLTSDVRAIPGVRSVGVSSSVPLSLAGNTTSYKASKDSAARGQRAEQAMVWRGYFETMGIPLRQGEDFGAERADGERAIVINEYLAGRLFPDGAALGRTIYDGEDAFRIVGIVADSKARSVGESRTGQSYVSMKQLYTKSESIVGVTLIVKTATDPARIAVPVRNAIAALDSKLAIFDTRTFDEHLSNSYLLPRAGALFFGLCGGMGLIIATIGVYGVMSFLVARQSRSVGIRMALGAEPGRILRMIVGSGLRLAVTGTAIGLVIAFAVSRAAHSLLYGIGPSDPLTFIAAPLALIAAALAACWIPARRAAKLDPLLALRHD